MLLSVDPYVKNCGHKREITHAKFSLNSLIHVIQNYMSAFKWIQGIQPFC